MLHYLRKYQKIIYLFVTVIIVISFSFFGTYNSMNQQDPRAETAFVSRDGRKISKGELEEMVSFLKTDAHDKWVFGGMWGPNFLNDGILQKDLMETGMAEVLMSHFSDQLKDDLDPKLQKEKHFRPYAHPEANFLNAQSAWNLFSPELSTHLNALKLADHATSKKALQDRIHLFLAERKFPAPFLAQVLSYQQKQYSWLPQDPNLQTADLSLFGYHTIEDWFGPQFLRLSAQLIINGAAVAKENGLQVSKEEALVDLQKLAAQSYAQNKQNPRIAALSLTEYYNEQLRILGIDQAKAVKIWQQVLLFRRLFDAVGSYAIVEALPFQKFHDFAKESATVTLYQLPESLRLNDLTSLQQFETYLDQIAKRDSKNPLALPTTFLTVDQVQKNAPDLVQKRYLVTLAHLDKTQLHARVSIKETWAWEVDPKNFAVLKKLYPALGNKETQSTEERLALLDGQDDSLRKSIDHFAREQILLSHPEWINEELSKREGSEVVITLSENLGGAPLVGLKNRKRLMGKLDALSSEETLTGFSQDEKNIYNITLLDRSKTFEILTFEEALSRGALTALVEKKLTFAGKSKEERSKELLQPILKEIQANKSVPKSLIPDLAAAYRFQNSLDDAKRSLQQGNHEGIVYTAALAKEEGKLDPREPLQTQWQLRAKQITQARSDKTQVIDLNLALSLKDQEFSSVAPLKGGGVAFFKLDEKGSLKDQEVEKEANLARATLAQAAQRAYLLRLLEEGMLPTLVAQDG